MVLLPVSRPHMGRTVSASACSEGEKRHATCPKRLVPEELARLPKQSRAILATRSPHCLTLPSQLSPIVGTRVTSFLPLRLVVGRAEGLSPLGAFSALAAPQLHLLSMAMIHSRAFAVNQKGERDSRFCGAASEST